MLNYTDFTQNTYIRSWTVTEIMAREKCGLLACSMYCMCSALQRFPHSSTVQCLLVASYVISATRSVSRCTYECKNRSCSYLLRVAKMPFMFSHVEYCDMHFVYRFCNWNALAAVEDYRRRFPDRRIPSCIYSYSPDIAWHRLSSKC